MQPCMWICLESSGNDPPFCHFANESVNKREENCEDKINELLRMCLIGANSVNDRLGRLGICVLLAPQVPKRQVWQAY